MKLRGSRRSQVLHVGDGFPTGAARRSGVRGPGGRLLGKLVPDALDGHDVAWTVRIVSDLTAQVRDVLVEGPIVDVGRIGVDFVEELRAGESYSGVP